MLGWTCPAAYGVTYSGVWIPTDNDINDFSFDNASGDTRTWEVYMFDWGVSNPTISDCFSLLVLGISDTASTIDFTKDDDNNWIIQSTIGSPTLNIGLTKEYGLFFYDPSSSTYQFSYDISLLSAPGQYTIVVGSEPSQDTFIQNDAMIPIPGSVLLLGTGLFGLALLGFRRRNKM